MRQRLVICCACLGLAAMVHVTVRDHFAVPRETVVADGPQTVGGRKRPLSDNDLKLQQEKLREKIRRRKWAEENPWYTRLPIIGPICTGVSIAYGVVTWPFSMLWWFVKWGLILLVALWVWRQLRRVTRDTQHA